MSSRYVVQSFCSVVVGKENHIKLHLICHVRSFGIGDIFYQLLKNILFQKMAFKFRKCKRNVFGKEKVYFADQRFKFFLKISNLHGVFQQPLNKFS